MKKINTIIVLTLAILITGSSYSILKAENEPEANQETIITTEIDKPEIVEEITQTDFDKFPASYIQEGFEGVKEAFESMLQGYKDQNDKQILNQVSDKDDVVFVTAGLQIYVGKKELAPAFERDFNKIKDIEIEAPWVSISGKGDIAWLSSIIRAKLTTPAGSANLYGRQTMVFEKNADGWRIVNSHFSYPAYKTSVSVKETPVKQQPQPKNATEE